MNAFIITTTNVINRNVHEMRLKEQILLLLGMCNYNLEYWELLQHKLQNNKEFPTTSIYLSYTLEGTISTEEL